MIYRLFITSRLTNIISYSRGQSAKLWVRLEDRLLIPSLIIRANYKRPEALCTVNLANRSNGECVTGTTGVHRECKYLIIRIILYLYIKEKIEICDFIYTLNVSGI